MAKRYPKKELPKLELTCTSTSCATGLHCYKPTAEMKRDGNYGTCRECGERLHNFEQVSSLNIEQLDVIIGCLQHETFRHAYWYHRDLDQWAVNYALRKGGVELRNAVIERLKKSLQPNNPFDGRQTPLSKNPIYYAQHATATCCRKCLEYWYNIPTIRPLSEDEINFFATLIMTYIFEKIPNLTDEGRHVPPIRNT